MYICIYIVYTCVHICRCMYVYVCMRVVTLIRRVLIAACEVVGAHGQVNGKREEDVVAVPHVHASARTPPPFPRSLWTHLPLPPPPPRTHTYTTSVFLFVLFCFPVAAFLMLQTCSHPSRHTTTITTRRTSVCEPLCVMGNRRRGEGRGGTEFVEGYIVSSASMWT